MSKAASRLGGTFDATNVQVDTSIAGSSGGALQTPGTLTDVTTNVATNSHTHAITSSSAPGLTHSLLSTANGGALSLAQLSIGTDTGLPPTNLLYITGPAANAGTHAAILVQPAAHTLLATTVESPDVDFNLARTVTWNAGNIATQRFFRIQRATIAFSAASTVNVAATMAITGAPNAGTNATITDAYTLWIQAGRTRFGDVICLDNAVQSGTPTNSGCLYATTGMAFWADSDGSTTQFAPIQFHKRTANQNMTVPAGYGCDILSDLEIASGIVVELASDSILEIQ